jgi:hypothetical protein
MIWRGRNEPRGAAAPDPALQQQGQQPPVPQQPQQQAVPPQQQPPAQQQPPPQQAEAPAQQAVPQQGEQGQVGSRIESVLGAAEQAAVGIREDAQEWARSYLEESRRRADEIASQRIQELTQLTDTLMSRARAVAAQSDELLSALDEAGRRVMSSVRPGGAGSEPSFPQPPSGYQQPEPPPQPVFEAQPAPSASATAASSTSATAASAAT